MEEQNNTQREQSKTSSTGLDENIAGLLCYLGMFVTGLIFTLLEKSSHFVRFHAMQSIVTFASIWIASFIVDFIPIVGWLLRMILSLLGFVLWIVLMVKAYQKELYKLPIVGDIAENLMKKFDNNAKPNDA